MISTRHLSILAAASLTAVCILTAPAFAGGGFSFTIADDNFALSFGAGDWAPYGAGWSDPGWSVDYRQSLASYGEWVWVDGLGSVWRPWVAAEWRPFSHGRWVWTSYGWTWVAYEPWGWLPHHYGSWALAPAGWVWVPGYEYRPANVVWVTSGHHVGWYPCGPQGWSHHARGFRHGYRHGYHDGRHDGYRQGRHDGYRNGYDDGWRDALEATWVDRRHLGADDLSRHAVSRDRLSRSGIIAKPAVLEGAPSRSELDRYAEQRIPEARISTRSVEMAGRQTVAVRAEGFGRDVAEHSATTVRTALSPAVAQRVERQLETSRAMRSNEDAADRRVVRPEQRSSEASPRGAASRAPATVQRTPPRDLRSVEPQRDTPARVKPSTRPPVRSSGIDTRAEVQREPAPTPAGRPEVERRRPTAPTAAVRSAPQVDRRRPPTTGAGSQGAPVRRSEEARPAPRTAPEVKAESRRTARTPRSKPETPRLPQAPKTRTQAGGNG